MKVFTDVRFWVAIGVVCLAVFVWLGSGLISAGQPPAPLPMSYRVLLLVFMLFAAVSMSFAIHLNSRRTNASVLQQITDGDPAADGGRSDPSMLNEEERQLRDKFTEAAAILKSKRLGGSGRKQHLYQLPWYVIIGSPGSGKTTAVRHSGLEFPLDNITQGSSLGGVGGTRNCDWWITTQAVLLDTAGRYTTQDSDAGYDARGWQNFLNLLRKNRKQQPINGVILVVGTDELLRMSDDQWAVHTRTVTSRLKELTEQLQMEFPVYLLVTKVDLLAGCREFFDSLDVDEQDQIWGTTLPPGSPLDALEPELEALNRRLHQQLPGKLRYERDTKRRQAIYSFPWQMESVTSRLNGLVKDVFSRQGVSERAKFRGLYFTSAVQEGSPIERLFAGITRGFGISGSVSTTQQRSRSLFLRNVFPSVIFPEAFLAGTNTAHDRRVKRWRMAAFAILLLLAVGLAFAWTGAFTLQRSLLTQAQEQLAVYNNTEHGPRQSLSQNLNSLQYLRAAADTYDQQNHPWLSNLGMYDGSVDESAKAAYLRTLRSEIAPALGGEVESWLSSHSSPDYLANFDALKAYLMLGDHQRRDLDWFLSWLGQSPIPEVKFASEANIQRHMEALFDRDPEFELGNLDDTTIARTRKILTRASGSEAVYSRIKQMYEGESTDLLPEMGPYFTGVFETRSESGLLVPTLFTVAGYQTVDFSIKSDAVLAWLDDRWVLGEEGVPNPLEVSRVAGGVRPLYAHDYISTWQGLIGGIDLIVPTDKDVMLDTLGYLSDPTMSPMSSLARLVATETTLPEQDNSASAAAQAAGGYLADKTGKLGRTAKKIAATQSLPEQLNIPGEVAAAFALQNNMVRGDAASKDAKVTAQLGDLRQWLHAVHNTPGSISGPDPSSRLLLTARDLAAPYSDWVASLAQGAKASVTSQRVGHLNSMWQREVAGACQRSFSNKFPFAHGADAETTLRDFENFYARNGILDSFVRENLLASLDKKDGTVSAGTVASIRHGERIRDAFFDRGEVLGFNYQLTGFDVDDRIGQLVIESGKDQRVRFKHGPPVPLELSWPDGDEGLTITFMRKDGSTKREVIEGPWAIFQAVAQSRQGSGERYANAGNILVTFTDGEYRAVFRLTTDRDPDPFAPGLLDTYRCRSSL